MSTKDYIPPPKDLEFWPQPPPFEEATPDQVWVLEIGPGKGEFVLHQAQENPRTIFTGVEIKRGRFEKIAKKAELFRLSNLYIIHGDARECLPRVFRPKLFDRIYILFPDPWPKTKHAKHRLIKLRLINELKYILKEKGEVYSATDAGYYSEQMTHAFREAGGFHCEAIPSLFPTYFETKWKALGRKIDYWKFVKL
jgi:tRNA (guanine-N7-)-methyltransferase